jgi:hypothetical protein
MGELEQQHFLVVAASACNRGREALHDDPAR